MLGQSHDLVRRGEVLLLLRAINHVGVLDAQQLLIGGDDDHFELVNLVELRSFRFRRTGHAGQLLVHAEVILEGHRGERLILALDLHAFLRFDGLVQAIGPAAARHQAAGELVDDEDFPILHHVLNVAAIQGMRLDRRLDVMLQRPILRVGDVADAEQAAQPSPILGRSP